MNFASLHCSLWHLVTVWRSGRFPFPKGAASLLKQKERKTKQLEATLFAFYQSRQDTISLWWVRDDLTNSEKTRVTVNVSPRGAIFGLIAKWLPLLFSPLLLVVGNQGKDFPPVHGLYAPILHGLPYYYT